METGRTLSRTWVYQLAACAGVAAGSYVAATVIGTGFASADASIAAADSSYTDWLLNPQDNLGTYEAGFAKTLTEAGDEFTKTNSLIAQLPSGDISDAISTNQTQMDSGAVTLLQSLDSAENTLQFEMDKFSPSVGLATATDLTDLNQLWDDLVGASVQGTAQEAVTAAVAGDPVQEVENHISAMAGADQLFLLPTVDITIDFIKLVNEIFPGMS